MMLVLLAGQHQLLIYYEEERVISLSLNTKLFSLDIKTDRLEYSSRVWQDMYPKKLSKSSLKKHHFMTK